MVNAQQWLDKHYPKNGTCQIKDESMYVDNFGKTREEIKRLDIYEKDLEGELDLSDFVNLEKLALPHNKLTSLNLSSCSRLVELYCNDELLTSITLPHKSTSLKKINLRNNNFPEQDLSFLSRFINLEEVWLENNDRAKLDQGIYNKFSGSLDFLSNMQQLKILNISNTDISEIDINKLPRSLEKIYYSTYNRSKCKLTEIVSLLDAWAWKDLHSDFVDGYYYDFVDKSKLLKKYWEEQRFTKEETNGWIQAGLNPYDYNFASYLRDAKKVNPQWVMDNKNREDYKKMRGSCNFCGWCRQCQKINTSPNWCKSCQEKELQIDLKQLSGRELVEGFAKQAGGQIEWIPYEQLTNLEYLAKGGFGEIYKAKWQKESGDFQSVVLKILDNSRDITENFLQEISNHKLFSNNNWITQCYGISQDPETKNYVMIIDYKNKGNLRQYLQSQSNELTFKDKFRRLMSIALGLNIIHKQNLVHRDFHSGNILNFRDGQGLLTSFISDLGLSQPASYRNQEGEIFGVLPYLAPEVLQGELYAKESDVYSFGIVAYEWLVNAYPYSEYEELKELDDNSFALKVCSGLRPNIDKVPIPQELKDLIKRCWDADPEQRPTAGSLRRVISKWDYFISNEEGIIANNAHTKFSKFSEWSGDESEKDFWFFQQYLKIKKEYNHWSQNILYKIPSKAVTTSKLINTKQIAQLFQESEERALELEIKKIEKEIDQPLTDELKELVSNFIQVRKKMRKSKNNKEVKAKAEELEDQLLDKKDLSEENIEKIIEYCKRFVDLEGWQNLEDQSQTIQVEKSEKNELFSDQEKTKVQQVKSDETILVIKQQGNQSISQEEKISPHKVQNQTQDFTAQIEESNWKKIFCCLGKRE